MYTSTFKATVELCDYILCQHLPCNQTTRTPYSKKIHACTTTVIESTWIKIYNPAAVYNYSSSESNCHSTLHDHCLVYERPLLSGFSNKSVQQAT